jgi:hypothetical protein
MNDATQFFNTVAGGGGYEIERSLRFNSADSAYLNRTPGSAGNRKTWTWAGWVKRSTFGTGYIFGCFTSGNDYCLVYPLSGGNIRFEAYNSGTRVLRLDTANLFRDPSAWYHFVFTLDTSNATESSRAKIYVNGIEVTLASGQYPTQNTDLQVNTTNAHEISSSVTPFNGYLADIHFIDGQALDPTSFGEFDDNGVWQPIEYAGTYGPLVDQSQTWSSNTSIPGGSPSEGTAYANLFDGAISAYPGDFLTAADGKIIQIDFATSLTNVTSIRYYSYNGSDRHKVNSGSWSANSGSGAGWKTAYSGSAITLTRLELQKADGASYVKIGAIEVNGELLVDSGVTVTDNSFHLPFSDNSTAAALGTDTSGNGNTWTVNNISVTNQLLTQDYTSGLSTAGGPASGYPYSNVFDEDTSNIFVTSGATTGTTWTFTPPSAISAASLVIRVSQGARYRVNGGSWTTFSGGGSGELDLSSSITGGSITSIEGESLGNYQIGLWYVVVNGNTLIQSSGVTSDSLVDSPTNGSQTDTGVGGEVVGNYATWNPLAKSSGVTMSNGNLDASNTTATQTALSTFFVSSGKWYAELTCNAGFEDGIGIATQEYVFSSGFYSSKKLMAFRATGNITTSSFGSAVFPSWSVGDVVRVRLDLDNQKFAIAINGGSFSEVTITSYNSHYAGELWSLCVHNGASGGAGSFGYSLNAGQRPFAYTAPSGFKALCTTNLAEPTIADGSTVMDVKLYTGNGSTQTISGLNFSPDLVWIKRRSVSSDHNLFDIIRGATKVIKSNNTDAEVTASTSLTAFNSDGFSVGSNSDVNGNTHPIVAWTWDAGSSTVTNTQGSISSQVRANASAGFSVVGFTATGATSIGTMGHGLGVAPSLIILKNRDVTDNWFIHHNALPSPTTSYLFFTTAAVSDQAPTPIWSTSSLTFGVRQSTISTGSQNCVAYCWTPVAGYSAFGSYTGNGSADGPFVYTGFRPRWVMIKGYTGSQGGSSNWLIIDTSRDTYNVAANKLAANLSDAENSVNIGTGTQNTIDILSNGFKPKTSNGSTNNGATSYVYAAFAEHPFATARAR